MASRKKIASDLPQQRWYRVLSPKWKALYIHLLCVANVAGIFEVDIDSLMFHVKCENISVDDIFSVYGNRIQRIPNHPDKGIIVGYVAFQHTFPKASNQWSWVEKELAKVGLSFPELERMRAKEGEQLMLELEPEGNKPKENEKPQRNTVPPKVEWVAEYCSARNNGVDAQAFCDFYESKGWKVGNQKMKDWQAAVRTWEKGNGRNAAPSAPVKLAAQKSPIRKVF